MALVFSSMPKQGLHHPCFVSTSWSLFYLHLQNSIDLGGGTIQQVSKLRNDRCTSYSADTHLCFAAHIPDLHLCRFIVLHISLDKENDRSAKVERGVRVHVDVRIDIPVDVQICVIVIIVI